MEEKPESIYAGRKISEEELEYYRKMRYPSKVSSLVLRDVDSHKVVDVGAGSGTQLGRWVHQSGGHYIGLDVFHQPLQVLSSFHFSVCGGSMLALPFADRTIETCHERFVLMHLPESDRERGIAEMLRIARFRAVFIERDWSTFQGNDLVNELRDFMLEKFPPNVDPYLGDRLEDLVKRVSENTVPCFVKSQKFSQPYEDGNYSELIAMVNGFYGAVRELRLPFADKVAEFARRLQAEWEKERPEPFTPPDIIAITATI